MPPCYKLAITASQLQARINHGSDKMSSFPSWANRRHLKHPNSNQDSAISENLNCFFSEVQPDIYPSSVHMDVWKLSLWCIQLPERYHEGVHVGYARPCLGPFLLRIICGNRASFRQPYVTRFVMIGSCDLPFQIECSNML